MLALILKLTIVLGSAFLAHALLQRASAATRYAVWLAAMVGLLLLPALEFVVPAVEVSAPVQTVLVAPASAPVSAAVVQGNESRSIPWAWIWAAGASAVLLRLGAGLWAVRRMLRKSRPVSSALFEKMRLRMDVSPDVKLVESGLAKTPMTLGAWRPVVVLPEGAQLWSRDRLAVVLSHELAHVRRTDWLSQMVVRVVCALYWFHPLVWWAERVMHREREHACDDMVLGLGVQPVAYAEHLLDIVRTASMPAWPATLPMASGTDLEVRLRALLSEGRRRGMLTRRIATIAGAAALCVLLPLAALRAPAQVNSAKLTGTVKDASGAVVPRAEVLIINNATKGREMTRSGMAGEYQFAGLPAGEYSVEVRKPGFMLSKTVIAVEPSRSTGHDVTLGLGSVSESMEIVGDRPAQQAKAPAAVRTPQKIRVGGSVQATRITKMVRPTYPDALKAQGIEGDVLLEAVISKEGKLLNVKSLNTIVNADLVAAAADAVKQWEYQPTLLNGEPVEVITTIHIGFHLK